MISPTKTADRVIEDGLPGERRAFTIKATGKAFRTLIDGLYENKIGAVVREIISNGYDSHAKAKTPEVPLKITAPTSIDPTFRVRDFGVSMDHDTIMDLYTTIFHSTKEETNDEVGQFGLGSKSPFAYTDTFSVTAFLDGEKRVYVAHISNDDVPQITHVVTEPQGDERQGIEVAIPVKPNDVFRFHEEITKMILGADVAPEVDGLGKNVPTPVYEGDGWRVIRDIYHWGYAAVRQGCVIYPVHSARVPSVSYGYTTIVDVPIGSVEVTASREALSLTPETEATVRAAFDSVEQKVNDLIDEINASFKNRLDAYNKQATYAWLARTIGRSDISLTPDKYHRYHGKPQDKTLPLWNGVMVMRSQRSKGLTNRIRNPEQLAVIVDDPAIKTPRRNARISKFYAQHRHSRTIAIVTRRELPRLVRLCGLKPDQVFAVDTLPDNPPAPRTNTKGRYAAPKTLPKGMMWLPKRGAMTVSLRIGGVYMKTSQDVMDRAHVWAALGLDVSKVVFLTERQASALKAPDSARFDKAVKAAAEKLAKKHNIKALVAARRQYCDIYNNSTQDQIYTTLSNRLHATYYDPIMSKVAARVSQELRRRYLPAEPAEINIPGVTLPSVRDFIIEASGAEQFDLQKFEWDAKVEEVLKPYEKLFTESKNKGALSYLLDYYIEHTQEEN